MYRQIENDFNFKFPRTSAKKTSHKRTQMLLRSVFHCKKYADELEMH